MAAACHCWGRRAALLASLSSQVLGIPYPAGIWADLF
jgi:hypothetical protein